MFIGASMLPDYFKDRINLFVALAPPTRIGHVKSTLLRLMAWDVDRIMHILIDDFGMYNFIAPNWIAEEITAEFCAHYREICGAFLQLFADLDVSVDNTDRIRTYMTHFPSGASYKCSVHYA
jgi:hypothetical protein